MQALASNPLQAAAIGNVVMVSVAERSDPKDMFMHKELSVKIRVRGDFHARFCERVRVKLPRSTRPMTLGNNLCNTVAEIASALVFGQKSENLFTSCL